MGDPLFQERKQKREAIMNSGISPYVKSFSVNAISSHLQKSDEIREADEIQKNQKNSVSLAGRLMTFREHGRLSFGTIQDKGGKMQLCFLREYTKISGLHNSDEKVHEQFWKKSLDIGDFLGATGDLFRTKHGEITLLVRELTLLSKSLRPLPEKWHGLSDREKCYRERNLDLISNPETFDRFQKRSAILREIRSFFHEKGFDEVETRTLQPQAGGAMAKVFTTHHNALDHDFVLRIALELDLKMAVGGGIDRVFEIGKNFRNEGIDPSHLQEFTMIEWYAAYDTLELHEKWIEELFRNICKNVFQKMVFQAFDKNEKPVEVDFSQSFKRATFAELLKKYADIDIFSTSDEILQKKAKDLGIEEIKNRGRGNLLDDIYKKTARPHLIQPTFVVNWPSELKPLAQPNGDGTSTASQLLVAGWEMTNGYGELIDPIIQRKFLEDQQKTKSKGDDEAMEVDEVFLKAMEHGFPPMTGNAIGIDRLCALLTGMPNLRDVVLFPTMKPVASRQLTEERREKEYKAVVVLINQEAKLEGWQAMNAVAHLTAAFGARHENPKELFCFNTIESSDSQKIHLNIRHEILIKSITSNAEIKTLIREARENNIEIAEFTREMLETTDDEIVKKKTSEKKFADIEHLGVLLFGNKKEVEKLTKVFSLWK